MRAKRVCQGPPAAEPTARRAGSPRETGRGAQRRGGAGPPSLPPPPGSRARLCRRPARPWPAPPARRGRASPGALFPRRFPRRGLVSVAPRPPAAMERTRAEVDATLQTAKLDAAELLPAAHCLRFGPAAAGDVCLLELEPALCGRLQAGRRWGATGEGAERTRGRRAQVGGRQGVQRGAGDRGRAERSPRCAGDCGRGVRRGARAPPRPLAPSPPRPLAPSPPRPLARDQRGGQPTQLAAPPR